MIKMAPGMKNINSFIMWLFLCILGTLASLTTGGSKEGAATIIKELSPMQNLSNNSIGNQAERETEIAKRGEEGRREDGGVKEEEEKEKEEEEGMREDGGVKEEEEKEKEEEEENEEEDPYFDPLMVSTYTGYLGKTATLTCIVHAVKSDKSVSWIRTRDLRILTVGRYTYTTDLRFEALHQQWSDEWILRIKYVQLRDQGNYQCQITTKPIRTFNVFLKVVEPWVEVLGAPHIYVNKQSMINLTCIVYHAPYPPKYITWYHRDEIISYTSPRGGVSVVEERSETTTSSLLVQNAQDSDTGTFSCHPHGMQAAVINLHVLEGEHRQAIQTNCSCIHSIQVSSLAVLMIILLNIPLIILVPCGLS